MESIAMEQKTSHIMDQSRKLAPWEFDKLGAHIDLLTGFPFKSSSFSENSKHTRLLRGVNITEGYVRYNQNINKYWKNVTSDVEKYFLKTDDLVISCIRIINA